MKLGKVLFLTLLAVLLGGHFAGAATIPVTTTIQAAIGLASDGDVIVIPAGTYIEKITIDGFNKLTITGAGPGLTTIDGTGLTGTLVTVTNSEKITIKNCSLDGVMVMGNGIFVEYSSKVTFMNCTVENADDGITLITTTGVAIKGCHIQNNSTGIYMAQSVKNKVMTSLITGNTLFGIFNINCHNTQITKNRITNNDTGIYSVNPMATVVKQNIISENNIQGIYHASYGTFGNVYIKNQIVNNIAPAAGVIVAAGLPTFVSNVISGNYAGVACVGAGTYCNIMKNTIMGNNPYGLYLSDSSGYMAKNYINGDGYGIYQQVSNPNVVSNIFTLISNKALNSLAPGVYSDDLIGIRIIDAEKNFIADNGGTGIACAVGLGSFIDKNRIVSNFGGGIGGGPTANIMSVTNNLVTANNDYGIGGGTFSMIYKNRVLANNGYGIIGFNGSHIEGNKVMGNAGSGIDGSYSSGSLIESNKAFGNGDGVTYFDLYDDSANDEWLYNKYGTYSLP